MLACKPGNLFADRPPSGGHVPPFVAPCTRPHRFRASPGASAGGLTDGLQAPLLEPRDRCLIVEDVVTTGGSTLQAIGAVREAGHEIVGVVAILDRLSGGADAIRDAVTAPYEALATIDDVYPDRPDRAG